MNKRQTRPVTSAACTVYNAHARPHDGKSGKANEPAQAQAQLLHMRDSEKDRIATLNPVPKRRSWASVNRKGARNEQWVANYQTCSLYRHPSTRLSDHDRGLTALFAFPATALFFRAISISHHPQYVGLQELSRSMNFFGITIFHLLQYLNEHLLGVDVLRNGGVDLETSGLNIEVGRCRGPEPRTSLLGVIDSGRGSFFSTPATFSSFLHRPDCPKYAYV
ncbi:hypothetical protein J6590_007936 [Homalodisca vitripennis]|nr:hypothetical protein J6590_007936 [Homalodisca vitripennis]